MTQQDQPVADTPAAEQPSRPSRAWVGHLLAGLWCVGLFLFCLWLYTRNNAFPVEFHPDEPGKVRQIIQDFRNYNHPQLLLEGTQIWLDYTGTPVTEDSVILAGRQVAAFFGAAATAMFALTAYLMVGWWGLVFGTLLFGLNPPILTYSHYMKEDTSLLIGVAMTVLASRIIWMTRRWYARIPAWVLIAAGTALAASGKYVGSMVVVLPLALVFLAPGFKWYRPLLRFLLVVPLILLFVGIVNHRALNPGGLDFAAVYETPSSWPILFHPGFLQGLENETDHSQGSHWGLTANRPNTYVLRTALSQSWPHAAIPAMALPLILVLTWRRGWGYEVLLITFAASCTFVLSHSIILFARYPLPITSLVYLLGVIALARLFAFSAPRPVTRTTLGCCTAVVLLAALLPICLDYTSQFRNDSRFALQDWAAKNLPQNARVFNDHYARMPLPYGPLENRGDLNIRTHFILGLMPGLQYQLTRSDAYYIICDLSYNRFFEPSVRAAPGNEDASARAKAFYEKLLTEHTPIWVAAPKRNMHAFTNPEIRVYHLTPDDFADFAKRPLRPLH